MKTAFLIGSVVTGPLIVLGQAGPDPISGGAGWVGAGLLGLVLAWLLLKHLPDKDRQFERFVENFTKETAAQREAFTLEQAELRVTFATEQNQARASFLQEQQAGRDFATRETNELRTMLYQTMKEMRTAVHDVRDTAQTAITSAALNQATHQQGGSGS